MLQKVLVANRGEIAVRVIRACRELGVRTVAIYSEADREALHVRYADEAVTCGPARATESYLRGDQIVALAQAVGADAVHPGYGFLSENAEFAEAVGRAGLVFIGPSPNVIREMGGKIAARARMIAAGVPVVPGGERIDSNAQAAEMAEAIGYPVLVKASAGGGGRGMRRVDAPADLETALERASSEALAAFGDGTVYLEKCLIGPRHIEIQVLADQAGHTIHLGERECSIQRRHQKLVEEAPAYGMTPELRAAMGDAAVRAAQAVGYVGAGTCEFLVDARGDFFFLEMNTRIQVEHPVTEEATGIDLVHWQLKIASGESLSIEQSDVSLDQHAIEARIYAEDPDKGFIPSPGSILGWSAPSGPGIRIDSGFEGGQTISSHYDPMIAKLVAIGRNREEALARFGHALDEFGIAGIRTGLPFLRRLTKNAAFRKGAYDTSFIESEMGDSLPDLSEDARRIVLVAVARVAAGEDFEGNRRFEIAFPKEDPVVVTVAASEKGPSSPNVTIGEDRSETEILGAKGLASSPFVTALHEGRIVPLSVTARKKGGGFDVGLPDRVVRVKCKERDDS